MRFEAVDEIGERLHAIDLDAVGAADRQPTGRAVADDLAVDLRDALGEWPVMLFEDSDFDFGTIRH
jgi:hypothetical protein